MEPGLGVGLRWNSHEGAVGGHAGDSNPQKLIGGKSCCEFDGNEVAGEGGSAARSGKKCGGLERDGFQFGADELDAVSTSFRCSESAKGSHAFGGDRGRDRIFGMKGPRARARPG